jgi:uncharacterized protein (TIGR02145 family)
MYNFKHKRVRGVMIKRTFKDKVRSSANNVGVFSFSLLVGLFAVYIYSPILGTNAVDGQDSDWQNISLAVETDKLNFDITPTSGGTLAAKTLNVAVDTSSAGGYELFLSSEDEENAMTSTYSTDKITSVTGKTSSLASNTWGYTTVGDSYYNKIPLKSSPATIANVDHLPGESEKSVMIRFGVKVSSSIKAAYYSKNVVLSVVAHEPPEPQKDLTMITTMQEMTPAVCDATEIHAKNTLTDARDQKTYTVAKLEDGRCWMTQNLATIGIEITPELSDMTSGSYTIPESDLEAFKNKDKVAVISLEAAYLGEYGGYYTWKVAAAGNEGNSANKSICPKGWHIPSTYATSGDFYNLTQYYNTVELLSGEPGYAQSGHTSSGSTPDKYAYTTSYWANHAVMDTANTFSLNFNTNTVTPYAYSSTRTNGFSVRCIANYAQKR